MEISTRALWTLIHGMGFGGLYLLACSGALVELWRRYAPASPASPDRENETFLRAYLLIMAVLAWLAVFSGAYIVYPWYRALPPPGTMDLHAYPQQLLLASPATAGWHALGMEWKEYVAWLAPMSITMAAGVSLRYRGQLRRLPALRNAVLGFVLVSLIAAGIAGFFGAEIDDRAPVRGGTVLHWMQKG
jgi:hypothetical protein